jgi:Big-like domain-containing protein
VVTSSPTTTGTIANDGAGFVVQAPTNTGPALFVLNSTNQPAVGDRVSFTVTATAIQTGAINYAKTTTGLHVDSSGHDISSMVQAGSTISDLVTNLTNYDEEVMDFSDITITGPFAAAGNAHSKALATTAAIPGGDINLKVRFPDTVINALGIATGCHADLTRVPLWNNGSEVEMMGWTTSDVAISGCPAFGVASISPADPSSGVSLSSVVTIAFTRPADATTLTAQTAVGPCSGVVQLSSDGFQTCMGFTSAAPTMGANNTQASFTPITSFPYLTTWKLKVAGTVKSTLGTPLPGEFDSVTGFTTTGPLCNAAGGVLNGSLVISQIYGAGGNSGATYQNDFIELHNRGNTTISIPANTYSVQYASATGSSWQVTPLPQIDIQAGHYILISEAGGPVGIALPAPEATGNISMAAGAGKVALASTLDPLVGVCPGLNVLDFVGFGTTANCFLGTGPTPAPSATKSAIRGANGCTNDSNNATDFSAVAVAPRNSTNTAPATCSCATVAVTLNETDSGPASGGEVDLCTLASVDGKPGLSFSVAKSATTPLIHGQIFETGLTPYSVQPANVIGQVGFGPINANPENQSGWTWTAATLDGPSDPNDNYSKALIAPAAPGAYWFTYRFSLDSGASWTYCDSDGAGANTGAQFDVTRLPTMTVTGP